jgi:hypothetical protein
MTRFHLPKRMRAYGVVAAAVGALAVFPVTPAAAAIPDPGAGSFLAIESYAPGFLGVTSCPGSVKLDVYSIAGFSTSGAPPVGATPDVTVTINLSGTCGLATESGTGSVTASGYAGCAVGASASWTRVGPSDALTIACTGFTWILNGGWSPLASILFPVQQIYSAVTYGDWQTAP